MSACFYWMRKTSSTSMLLPCLLFALLMSYHGGLCDRVAITKSSAILTEGSNATLPCRVFAQTEWVQWSKGQGTSRDFLIHMSKEKRKIGPGYESRRFDMDESYSLNIMNVTKSDEGRYLCEILESGTNQFFSNLTDVTVSDIPYLNIVGCSNQRDCNFTASAEEEHVVLTCSVIGARGPISLFWRGEEAEDIIISVSTYSDTPLNYSLTIRETMEIIRKRKQVTCVAEAPNEYETLRKTVFLYIHSTNNTPSCIHSKGELNGSTNHGSLIAVSIVMCISLLGNLLFATFVHDMLGLMRKLKRCSRNNVDIDQENIKLLHKQVDEVDQGVKRKLIKRVIGRYLQLRPKEGILVLHQSYKSKEYNDPIHGTITMPPYCQMIIDTPEFQRLRYIKQLSCACYVYPTAMHTRFDHSIGVSHLAGKLVKSLQEDASINISDKDGICIQIAGLCHDLGHGPFSHDFERLIGKNQTGKKWRHEDASIDVFKHLIKKNSLEQPFEQLGLDDTNIEFICDLIRGGCEKSKIPGDRFFLYQIVSNKVNGIDVDRWDYMKRDSHFLGIKSQDFDRIFYNTWVVEVQKSGTRRKEIGYKEKVKDNVANYFLARRDLYQKAYKHKVNSSISIMVLDALREAGQALTYGSEDGHEITLLDSVNNPYVFCQLNDGILHDIMHARSTDDEQLDDKMMKAQEIIERIHTRQLYQCIVEIRDADSKLHTIDEGGIKTWIEEHMTNVTQQSDDEIKPDIWSSENIVLELLHFDLGHQQHNPFNSIPFVKKHDHGEHEQHKYLNKDEMPSNFPQMINNFTVRIFTRVPAKKYYITDKDRDLFYQKAIATGLLKEHRTPYTPPRKSSDLPADRDSQEIEGTDDVASKSLDRKGVKRVLQF